MFFGAINTSESISQNKYQSNTLNKNVIVTKKNTQHKWLVLLIQKVAFQLICSTYHHCRIQEDNPQCSVKYQMTFSYQMARIHNSSKIVNTWTFDRLTPNGNEGVGVQIDYLEHAYGTRYYVINKVNGQINAIHDDSLELTEFKGRFSPFDLDNLESKV